MTNEEIQEIVAKADAEYDRLKDRVHEQYDEIKRLKEEYVMLQNASDEVEEEKDREIERLQDLCNKYEEEHKTTFEEWKKAINIIKEVREKIESVQLFGLRSGKTLIATLLNDILKILDKEKE